MASLPEEFTHGEQRFQSLEKCSTENRERQSIACDLYGTLVRSRASFPYFMLVAFEAGSVLRAIILLLSSPVAWFIYHCISESACIKLLIFVTFVGLRVKEIETCARTVLPRFYTSDLHWETWRVFSSFGKRYVITGSPRVMVEHFAKEYLGADEVICTEIEVSSGGRATGFVRPPGVLLSMDKRNALKAACDGKDAPDVGVGDRKHDHPFLTYCKEGYVVPADSGCQSAAPNGRLAKSIVFHDGRLVQCPSPLCSLLMLIWLPIGFVLAIIRIVVGTLLGKMRMSWLFYAYNLLGVRIRVKGTPPTQANSGDPKLGLLFICTHRTLLDPIILSIALGRPVTAVTYSISRLSEFLSPIKTVALTRRRDADAAMIRKLLQEGDLVMCPEGTTCREPFLLRFSALFAELSDQIVPVAMKNAMSLFHGTTVTGWKGMDPFFFFMNPSPLYEVTFLNQLPQELTCSAGKNSYEVANHIQRVLGGVLGFECTNLTRRDKYRILAGTDGSVETTIPKLP